MKRMQLVAFLIAVVFLQVLVALPFVVTELGGEYAAVGLLIGCSQFFYAGGSLLLHNFVDRFGQRRVLWMVFPAMAVLTALFAIAPNIPVLFVLVAAVSLVLALFWTSMECLFSSQEEEGKLVRRLARYSVSWSAGDAVGAWLGAVLVKIHLRLPFLVAAVLVVVCWALLAWLEKSGKLERAYAAPPKPAEDLHGGERFLPTTRSLIFFMMCVVGIMFSFVPLVLAKEFSHWEQVGSSVIAIQPLVQAATFLLFGYRDRWVHSVWILWLCPLVMIIGASLVTLALLPSMPLEWGAWCFRLGLSGVGAALAIGFLMNLLYSLERPDTRARNSGIHEALVGMGMMLGPVLAGFGAKSAGTGKGAFWVALGLAAMALVLSQTIWLATRRRSRV